MTAGQSFDTILERARNIAGGSYSWIEFYGRVYGPTGLLAGSLATPAERAAYESSPQAKEVEQLLQLLIRRATQPVVVPRDQAEASTPAISVGLKERVQEVKRTTRY